MPKPFKMQSARPLPPQAEIVSHDGIPHVRLKERGRVVLCPLSEDGTKFLKPSRCWYFKCRDRNGTVKRVKGYPDLKATEQKAAEWERREARIGSGLIDATAEHARRPLAEHLTDYGETLRGKGDTEQHVAQTQGRITALLTGCQFVYWADADVGRVSAWLNQLRRGTTPVVVPPGASFKLTEVVALLSVNRQSVGLMVKRLKLTATGYGKSRRYPRATVEALAVSRCKGCGPETVNHYIRAVRGFFRWLVKAKRATTNPLDSLELVNAAVEIRHARRELSADELRRLFDAARTSTRTFRGLVGQDRWALYLCATGTGFRASALASLKPADFDWIASTVTLATRLNKSRKLKVQPLPPDIAATLRAYLMVKPLRDRIWGGTWASEGKAAEMLRIDLDAAGIPYVVEGPDGPEYADFHALRHSYLTLGGRSGIDLRTLQELAGHSTPVLTARYSHRRLDDLTAAVGKLPNLLPTSKAEATTVETPLRGSANQQRSSESESIAQPSAISLSVVDPADIWRQTAVPPAVPTGGAEGHLSALIYTEQALSTDRTLVVWESPQVLDLEVVSTDLHSSALSAPCRTRTYNPLIKSPTVCDCNSNPINTFGNASTNCCSVGCSDYATTPQRSGHPRH